MSEQGKDGILSIHRRDSRNSASFRYYSQNRILGVSVAHIFARTSIAISDIHYPFDILSTTIE